MIVQLHLADTKSFVLPLPCTPMEGTRSFLLPSSNTTFPSPVARYLEHMRLKVGDPSAWFAYSGDEVEAKGRTAEGGAER